MPPKRKRPAVVYIIEDDEEDLPNQVHSIDDEEELDVLRQSLSFTVQRRSSY